MPAKVPLNIAKRKYSRHRAQAKFRNIGFHFTFDEWYQWWLNHGVDKNIEVSYANDRQRLCMCRLGDTGGYEPSNVYLASAPENASHSHANGRANYMSNPRKTYRYGDTLYSNREMTVNHKINPKDLRLYHADRYDEMNNHETQRLINRWLKLPNRHQKFWCTDTGKFGSRTEAADSLGISIHLYGYYCKTGRYKIVKELAVPSLVEYIKTHSRYPNPVLPLDLDDYDK
jgi:hypothetical protein